MEIQAFADDGRTWTVTYVVYDPSSRDAVVIDPVLDLDTTPWRTSTESIDQVTSFIEKELNWQPRHDSHSAASVPLPASLTHLPLLTAVGRPSKSASKRPAGALKGREAGGP